MVTAIERSRSSCITAVFGRDEARLNAFADKYNIAKRFNSIQTLLDDVEVDVIYVGLPSHLHAEAVIAAAKRGKAILSEKSLATTMSESNAMIEAVRQADIFFLEGLMYLCHPLMVKLAEIIRSGELGQIRSISGHYAADIGKKANPLGMGTIYNLGCYPVSLVHFISETAFGGDVFKVRRVHATGNVIRDGTDRVQDAALAIWFGNGVLATIQSSDSFGNDFGFVINGEKASLRFKSNPWLPSGGENVIEIKQYGGATKQVVVNAQHDAFDCQVRTVEDCVSAGLKQAPRPSPNWTHSLEIMSLLTEWEEHIMRASI
ncbi:hypothetical protein TruAng_007642 [Truncatella angustata]|nr:hypothetical protein TruAng_007642 [Truncatella angustata]